MQMLQPGAISSMNMDTITFLAERFLMHPEQYITLITENFKESTSSKTLFLLVIMQSFLMQKSSMVPIPFSHCYMPFITLFCLVYCKY